MLWRTMYEIFAFIFWQAMVIPKMLVANKCSGVLFRLFILSIKIWHLSFQKKIVNLRETGGINRFEVISHWSEQQIIFSSRSKLHLLKPISFTPKNTSKTKYCAFRAAYYSPFKLNFEFCFLFCSTLNNIFVKIVLFAGSDVVPSIQIIMP